MRGYTFPWAYLHRRHDRSVFAGWSWLGRRHRPSRFVWRTAIAATRATTPSRSCRPRCSGSIWRSAAIPGRVRQARPGGTAAGRRLHGVSDPVGDPHPAAASTGRPSTPQFVTAPEVADVGTWSGTGPLKGRVGGWAHKVVRWAFEAQGLYATGNPLEVVDSPAGRRKSTSSSIPAAPSDGPYDRGGYMPVSLDWHGGADSPGMPSPNALQVVAGKVMVDGAQSRPDGCGRRQSEVWCIEWASGRSLRRRGPGGTVDPMSDKAPPTPCLNGRRPPRSHSTLRAADFPSGTRLLILAEANCPRSREHQRLTGLPCSVETVPIVDIVAGENNLGLRVYRVP